MDAAQMLEQARAMLQANNLPINAANLNRASLAIARGEATLPAEGAEDASPQRSVQTRTRRNAPAAVTGQGGGFAGEENPLVAAVDRQIAAGGMGSDVAPREVVSTPELNAQPAGADLMAQFPGSGGEMAGTNVTAGQAIGTLLGDQMLPAAAMVMAPALAAPRAAPQMRLMFNRPQVSGPQNAGRIAGGSDDAGRVAGNAPTPIAPSGGNAALPQPAQRIAGPTGPAQAAPVANAPPVIQMGQNQASRTVDQVENQLMDAFRRGDQRAQEVLLGSLSGPQALAQRATRARRGGPRGQTSARRNNE